VLNAGSHSISMFPNAGDGTFGPDLVFGAGPLPMDLVVGDFTGDGALDLGPVVNADFLIDGLAVVPGQPGGTPWVDLGGGLPGAAGVPALQGAGLLKPGGKVTFTVEGALQGSVAAFVIGLSQIGFPLFGGILIPSPDAVVVLPTSPEGVAVLAVQPIPSLPPGQAVFAQSWVIDAAAVQGVASSNAVSAP
jgi:hypothetical protein